MEGVLLNVNVRPPSMDTSADDGMDAAKSDASAVVGPALSDTITVHVMGFSARCGDAILHDRLDADVGVP